jgi:hypothetical protein
VTFQQLSLNSISAIKFELPPPLTPNTLSQLKLLSLSLSIELLLELSGLQGLLPMLLRVASAAQPTPPMHERRATIHP